MKNVFLAALALMVSVGAHAEEGRGLDPVQDLPRTWQGEYSQPGSRMPMRLEITALSRATGPNRTPGLTVLDAAGAVTVGAETYPLKQIRLMQVPARNGSYEIYFYFNHEFAFNLIGQVKREADGTWKAAAYPQNGWRAWALTAN